MLDLLTVGEAFQDLIFVGLPHLPRRGEELRVRQFVATVGGGAVITATAAARLGLRTLVVSALSAEAAVALRRDRVQVVNLKRVSEPHAVSVSLSTTSDRSFVTFNGVNDRLEGRLPAAIARHPARHVHLAFAPRDCGRWTRIVNRLRARGVTTSWDFGWNPRLRTAAGFSALIEAADLVFLNEAEAALYARAHRRARNTVIKLGPRGSRWGTVSAPAPRVRAVDTTGAGDAFNGGFLFAWLGGRPARECLRLGNFVGAQSTLAAGGVDALPTRPTRLTRP
jgi:sugar/nucleoside kinase (ribokinase family)